MSADLSVDGIVDVLAVRATVEGATRHGSTQHGIYSSAHCLPFRIVVRIAPPTPMSREQIDAGRAEVAQMIETVAREVGARVDRLAWHDFGRGPARGYSLLSLWAYGQEHRERFWDASLAAHASPTVQLMLRQVVRALVQRAYTVVPSQSPNSAPSPAEWAPPLDDGSDG